ncbi:MAG: MurT ligase domain-containing protein [Solirubrobacteraceae bacterium]
MADTLAAKLALARGVGAISRRRGGGGTSAPGKLLMRLAPGAIGRLGARLPRGSVLISATNGKTTTAAMAAGILERAGISLVHNQAGANMAGGIATTLLAAARPRGAIAGELGLFEVDELWLAQLASELRPRAILLGNLFRDQLDRYGELDTIAERWEEVLRERGAASGGERKLVLNADDPLIADLGREHAGVLYFGMDDDSLALPGMAHAADAKHCRRCGAPYVFDAIYLGHLGHYHCASCGRSRPAPAVTATDVRLEGVRAARFTLSTPAGQAEVSLALPGLYNVYNALAAAALATALSVPLGTIVAGLDATRPAFGRAETVTLSVPALPAAAAAAAGTPAGTDAAASPATRELRILLVKNPAGANEVLRTLALEPGEHDLLGVLNDHIADGRDVSWIWDADFELLTGRIRRATCSGTRAADLAARLKYAGIDPARIDVREDLADALRTAAADRPGPAKRLGAGDERGGSAAAPLFALPTYTAMLALRELLVERGEASSAWS